MVRCSLTRSTSSRGLAGSLLLVGATGEGLTALVEEGVDVPADSLACAVSGVEDAVRRRQRKRVIGSISMGNRLLSEMGREMTGGHTHPLMAFPAPSPAELPVVPAEFVEDILF